MSFYQPEIFANLSELEYEKSTRILQPVWDFIKDGREDALRSPLFPPMLAVTFYLIAASICTVVDLFGQDIPIIKRYRFQPERKLNWAMVRNTLGNAFWNHLLLVFPMATVQLIWVPPTPLPIVAPTLWEFCWHQIAWTFLFDFEYWAWHAIHHRVKFLYRWCHAVHHQYSAPFALSTQYLHPWEIFFVGFGITLTPWFFAPHCMTYWSWFVLTNWMSIEDHCGYNLPWAAHHWIPIYGGGPAHDMHHMRPLTNFEPWLNWLDYLAGWKLTHKQLAEMKQKKSGNNWKIQKRFIRRTQKMELNLLFSSAVLLECKVEVRINIYF